MIYFKDPDGIVFAYDETDESQLPLIEQAQKDGWPEVKDWPPTPTLDDAKTAKLAEIKEAFANAAKQGCMVSLGLKMDSDIGNIQTLETAYNLSKLAGETAMTIVDYDNNVHSAIVMADVEKILVETGAYYRALYMQKQALRQQVTQASTPEAVAAVVWDG